MTVRVGSKGQIVIPKEIRDRVSLHPGDEVVVELHGTANTLTITAADKIMVTGSGNKVSYGRKGLTTKRPKLVKLGVRNKYKALK